MFNLIQKWFQIKQCWKIRSGVELGEYLVDGERLLEEVQNNRRIKSFKTPCGKHIVRFNDIYWAWKRGTKYQDLEPNCEHMRWSTDSQWFRRSCTTSLRNILDKYSAEVDLFSIRATGFDYKKFVNKM